jgi:plastocyanin
MLIAARATFASITTNVSIGDNFFSPATVTLNVNDQVKWSWTGAALNTHSSTSDTAGLWDSGIRNGGASPFTNRFTTAGTFPYRCTVHSLTQKGTITVLAPAVPPTISITNPADGLVLAAPAGLALQATAADSDGTVTNVQFFQGATLLGGRAAAPYALGVSNLATGDYGFSAVATDSTGLKATNAVTIHVVTAGPVLLSSPQLIGPGTFQFNYTANAGLRYLVQRSGDFANWTGLRTNTAAGSSVNFVDTNAPAGPAFYRVGLVPNP